MTVNEVVSVPVHPGLRGLLDAVVGYHLEGSRPGVHVGMPSRSLTMILTIDEPIEVSWPRAASPSPTPYASFVGGFHTQPAHVHHAGRQLGIQLGLTPGGARALLGLPAAELPPAALISVGDVLGDGVGQLSERVASAGDWQTRLAIVQAWLLRHAEGAKHQLRPEVAEVWRLLCFTDGRMPVGRAAELVGWSPRHLAARFGAEIGLAPKLAARVMRFERSHRLMASGLALARIAGRCGYADQSHMIREWQQFAGSSPTRWMRSDEIAFLQDVSGGLSPD